MAKETCLLSRRIFISELSDYFVARILRRIRDPLIRLIFMRDLSGGAKAPFSPGRRRSRSRALFVFSEDLRFSPERGIALFQEDNTA